MIKEIRYGSFDPSYTPDDISRYNLLRSLLGTDDKLDELYIQEEMKTLKAKSATMNTLNDKSNIESFSFGSSAINGVVYTIEV